MFDDFLEHLLHAAAFVLGGIVGTTFAWPMVGFALWLTGVCK